MSLHFFGFSLSFLFLSLYGLYLRRHNIMLMFLYAELSLMALMLLFIFISYYIDDIFGKIITLFLLTLMAVEAAIGLGLLLIYFRSSNTLNLDEMYTNLKK